MRVNRAAAALLVVLVGAHLPAQAAIEGQTWLPLGPAPITDFFGGGVSGRASAIAVNPARVDELWIGTAAGGVWHSVNGGVDWTPIADDQAALAIGAIAVSGCSSAGCAKVYAGTGENAIRRETYYGRGLLVLDNEAKTPSWSLRSGAPYRFEFGSINDVVLDPGTTGPSQRIFVTLSSGNTSSSSQATVTAPEVLTRGQGGGGYGLYRSDDDGLTWTKLTVPGAEGTKPTDLKMDPGDPATLYAGFLGAGVFKSTDGGVTWCPLTEGAALPSGCPDPDGLLPAVAGGFDHVEIALHAADPQTVYVTLGHCADQLLQSCQPSVFRTTDGGATWVERRRGDTAGAGVSCPSIYSRYTHGLAVHPTLPDVVLLGGVRLCRSTDGGASFFPSDNNLEPGTSPWGPIIHLDHREMAFHPLDANRVYNTNDGGFAYSVNGGLDWRPGNDDLQITGFYSLTSSPNTPRVIGGSQDNSGQLWRGFRAWDHTGFGDGAYAVIDLDDPLIMYLGFNSGGLVRSSNGGLTFSNSIRPPGTNGGNSAFNAPVVQDDEAPHALYYGSNQLHRSANDGSTWTVISPVLATGTVDEISPGQNVITAIGARGARVYAGYYGGELFTSTAPCANLTCWTDVSAGLPASPITDLIIDRKDADVAYVAVSGFAPGVHVFKTVNGGDDWTPAAAGLPAGVPANALAQESDGTLWVGLDSGPAPVRSNVYRSVDGGATWTPQNGGLPNAPVHDLSIDNSRARIYAGLHGRGAYVLGAAFVGTYEGRVDGVLRDVPLYGGNFPPNEACTVRLLQRTGHECAAGSIDALGAQVRTLPTGALIGRRGAQWDDTSAVWACFQGNCLGGTPIAQCRDDADGDGVADPLSTVVVECGGTPGVATIVGSPTLSNPPGSLIDIGFYAAGASSERAQTASVVARREVPSAATAFEVTVHTASNRRSVPACRVAVAAAAGRAPRAILAQSRAAMESHDACRRAGVTATLEALPATAGEDLAAARPRLLIGARDRPGDQVVAGVHVRPGDVAPGTCFAVQGLGIPMLSQLRPMRTTFTTTHAGAAGGYVTYIERTGLGSCAVSVATDRGDDASAIAGAIGKRLATAAPNDPFCAARNNPRSVVREGASLLSAFASDIQVCVHDAGVGFSLVPE